LQTITFYSYKGGVGRTLVVANVARYLALLGQRVVALDFDLEAPGLHYKLLPPGQIRNAPVKTGIVDYVHEFAVEGQIRDSLGDIAIELPMSSATKGSIVLIPAGAVPTSNYWQKLAQINWYDFLYRGDARGAIFFLDLKERIQRELQPDFLLIDSRTGITEIGGVATTILPEKVVCLLLHNQENLEGARAVLRSLPRASSTAFAPCGSCTCTVSHPHNEGSTG
jgi:MinD-like ATPase involved in chromosome partitioning or flagellar assembly